MSFSLAGSNITQSGTDTTLAGLSSVSGVTTFVQSGKTVYNIGDKTLAITGTLTMDPRYEELWTGGSVPMGSGNGNNGAAIYITGTLNIGVNITVNSVQAFPMASAIRLNTPVPGTISVADPAQPCGPVVTTGGTLNWLYGSIYSYASLWLGTTSNAASGTSNIYSKSCSFVALGTSGSENVAAQIRQHSTQTNILGMSAVGVFGTAMVGNPTSFSSVDYKHFGNAFTTSGSTPDATWLTVSNYESGGGHTRDFGFWQGKWCRFTNAINGSNMVVGAANGPASGNFNYGLVETRQALTLTAKNSALAAITTGGWWLSDVNNGSRLAANSLGNSKTNDDYTATRTYTADFNGSGVAAYSTAGGILTHVAYRVFANAASSPDTATENRRDYRGNSNDNSDNFTVRIRAYGYQFTQQTVTLKGAGGTSVNVTLNTNVAVVASKTTAAAYTGVSINGSAKTITLSGARTVQELYDYSQAWGESSGNRQYDECITSADGANFSLASGWVLSATENLTYSGKRITGGTVTLGTAGTYSPALGTTTLRFTTAGSYNLAGINATGTITLTNTSGGSVTVELPTGVTYVNSGPNITVNTPSVYASATILANSRVQLYNVTTSTEIENVFVTGTSYSKAITTQASNGDTLRLRVCKKGRIGAEIFAVWSSATGATFLVSQPEDTVYTAWGIDGDTVTEFSLDGTNLHIDANDVDGATTKTRLGAFYSAALASSSSGVGIANFFGALTFLSTAAIRVNTAVANLYIDNTNATTALRFTDLDVRLYKDDGTTIIAATSYSIHNDYSGVPDVVETGVSGLTGAESAQLMGLPSAASNASAVWGSTDGHFVARAMRNKFVTNPATGVATLYEDDGTTVLAQGQVYEDAAGSQPYRGQGAERRERLA